MSILVALYIVALILVPVYFMAVNKSKWNTALRTATQAVEKHYNDKVADATSSLHALHADLERAKIRADAAEEKVRQLTRDYNNLNLHFTGRVEIERNQTARIDGLQQALKSIAQVVASTLSDSQNDS